jgi:hypothetical protein
VCGRVRACTHATCWWLPCDSWPFRAQGRLCTSSMQHMLSLFIHETVFAAAGPCRLTLTCSMCVHAVGTNRLRHNLRHAAPQAVQQAGRDACLQGPVERAGLWLETCPTTCGLPRSCHHAMYRNSVRAPARACACLRTQSRTRAGPECEECEAAVQSGTYKPWLNLPLIICAVWWLPLTPGSRWCGAHWQHHDAPAQLQPVDCCGCWDYERRL